MMVYLYDLIYMIPLCLLAEAYGLRLNLFAGDLKGAFFLSAMIIAISMIARYCQGRLRILLIAFLGLVTLLTVITDGSAGGGDILQQYGKSTAIISLTVLVCLLVFHMQLAGVRRFITLLPLVALLAGMFLQVSPPKGVFAIGILPILAGSVEEVQAHWKKSGDTEPKKHLVAISPVLLLLCFLVFAIPTSAKPFDWSFTVRIWERTADVFIRLQNRLSGQDDYERQIGFSENGEFVANLSESDPRDVMEVQLGKNSGSVLYLRGKTFDRFNGRGWKTTLEGDQPFRNEEYNEIIRNINTKAGNLRDKYMRRVDLKIRYLDFRTQYVFAPLNTNVSYIHIKGSDVQGKGDDILASSQLGYDTMYDISYYRLNRDDKEFQTFLRNQSSTMEKEPLNLRASWVYNTYLPETKISSRARTYIQQELEGLESNYDKLLKIESLLSEMEYSLSPGKLPENIKDEAGFLDHLLFQKKKGYCSYYASAFVILARSLGIPARYVQGYCVRGESGECVTVSSNDAHAWPEAYIEGFGWLAFEPTPGKKVISSWEDQDRQRSGAVYDPTEHYRKHVQGKKHGAHDNSGKQEKVSSPAISWVFGAFLFTGLLLLLICLCLVVTNLVTKWRYRHMSLPERYQSLCRMNLRLLKVLGYELTEGETLQEFRLRCVGCLEEDEVIFLSGMQACLYGKDGVEGQMLLQAGKCMDRLYRRIYEQKGKWKYLYWRYIKNSLFSGDIF